MNIPIAATTSADGWDEPSGESGWNDGDNWGDEPAVGPTAESKKVDERKQKAEQRRLEMEKKRQAKQTGPMKLGAKKVDDPPLF